MRCSDAIGSIGGRSITWLRSLNCSDCTGRDVPHQLKYWRVWSKISSGVSTIFKVLPLWPFCPPGYFSDRSRKGVFRFSLDISLDGGLELFLIVFLCSNSLVRAFSCIISLRSKVFSLHRNFTSTSNENSRSNMYLLFSTMSLFTLFSLWKVPFLL